MANRVAFVFGMCAVACVAFGAATPDNFALKMEKLADDQILVVGSWTIGEVQGWSFGVCHNAAEAAIGTCAGVQLKCENAATKCPSISCANDLVTSKDGGMPSYVTMNVFGGDAVKPGGLTQGVVLDFDSVVTLPIDDRFEIVSVKYVLTAANAALTFCGTLGSPLTETVFVWDGNSIAPATQTGITIGLPVQTCDLKMNLGKQGDDKVTVMLDTAKDQAVSAFSFGIADDSAQVVVSSIDKGAAVKALMGAGVEPEFWSGRIVNGGATVGCVFTLGADPKLLPACTASQEITVVSYGNTGGQSATANVTLSSDLGTPKTDVTVSDLDGNPFYPAVGAGVSVTVAGGVVEASFVRGDVNQDGKLNVSDGVAIARYVFNLGSLKAKIDNCKDSADANDSGAIDTADALFVLNYLFTGGPIVLAPFPACGKDTTADTLTCVQYQCP